MISAKLLDDFALAKYIIAAILARTATGSAVVAVVLLSRQFGAEGALVGALSASLTLPHILGPVYGRWLEKSNNGYLVIAIACLLFTICFQLFIFSIKWHHLWLGFVSLMLSGACASFMMGGLSTQLNHLVSDALLVKRKAQSWDTLTYGIGLTAGPMLVAVMTSQFSMEFATTFVMSLPVFAGLILLLISKPDMLKNANMIAVPSFQQVVTMLWQTPALKKTLFMTAGAAFAVAALHVIAVYYSEAFKQGPESGALLVTLYGVGCLIGAMGLVFKPMKKDALTLLNRVGCLLVLSLFLLAFSTSITFSMFTFCLCGVVNSVFFAATIAARTEYSPSQGAAQIYMWIAAAKITAASFGAFLAGILVDYSIILPLISSIIVLSAILLLCFIKRER
jgi:MFS family permease